MVNLLRGRRSLGTRPARPLASTRCAPPIRWCSRRRSARRSPTAAYLLVEATSNQVDQFGGYTGMTPGGLPRAGAARRGPARARSAPAWCSAATTSGPNRWRDRPAEEALALAEELVAAYVAAGYTKIHLDCSMSCAGRSGAARRRARRRARGPPAAGRRGHRRAGRHDRVGLLRHRHRGAGSRRRARDARAAEPRRPPPPRRHTLASHRAAFAAAGLGRRLAARRGARRAARRSSSTTSRSSTTTGPARASCAPSSKTSRTSSSRRTPPTTRRPRTAAELVEDHWAILKVGPGLTFALREALFAPGAHRGRARCR